MSQCGKTVKGGDDWTGKQARCPNCGSNIQFPAQTTIIPPKRLEPPKRQAAAPPPNPEPIFLESRPEPPAPVAHVTVDHRNPHVTIDHRHKAVSGGFRTGFGVMLGCLTAGAIFFVGGCVLLAIIGASVSDDMNKALEESNKSFEREMAKAQQDVERQMEQAEQQAEAQAALLNRQFQTTLRTRTPTADSQNFDFKNVTVKADSGLTRVIGEVTNNSDRSYSIASFVVTLYDKQGKLLDRLRKCEQFGERPN